MLDALCQGIESYWSVKSTPESKAYARAAIESVLRHAVDYLAFCGSDSVSVAAASSLVSLRVPDGETHSGPTNSQSEPQADAAKAMLRAANLGGKAINLTQTTAPHAMSYKLTSEFGLAHGLAVALCLGPVWHYMLEHVDDECVDPRGPDYLRDVFADLDEMFMATGWAPSGPDGFGRFVEILALPLPRSLEEVQSGPEPQLYSVVYNLASSVNTQRLANNPVGLSPEALTIIYSEILRYSDRASSVAIVEPQCRTQDSG